MQPSGITPVIHIESTVDPRVPPVLMDEKKIKQVLINLLMNAIHAVARNETIRITTSLDETASRVRESRKKVFPGFSTGFLPPNPPARATGLGLSVNYGISKGHGGNITVENNPGKGAAFTLSLAVTAPFSGR